MCTFNVSPEGARWLVRYWCRSDGLYALRNPDEIESRENELRYKSDKAHLLKEMQGFHPALLRVAKMTTDVLPLWRCTTRDPLKMFHRGRLVVIGDASHPVKPHIGQGAISAIEDAAVLGTLFRDVPSSGDVAEHISKRLELDDKLRIPRVAAYKYYSDIPFFRNTIDEQRDKCEKFMKPEDLPGKIRSSLLKF
jgi:2-polyprenyl-6-methoxyphenol hydroxylase-like FAD-dependent oxidoreductase